MFVVFDYNTLVSSRVLEVIWNKDTIDTEELLMGNDTKTSTMSICT